MKTFLAILQLVPALIELIKATESAIPGSGNGAAKLSMIRQIMEAAYDGISEMWPVIEKIISAIVGVFNETGAFETK